jgi:hypothetical protein
MEKTGREVFVEYLRRVFLYSGPWSNKELEIISVDKPEQELVFEQFFEEPEKYPIITVGTTGGTHVSMSFNNQVENIYDFLFPLGNRSLSLVEFSTNSPFAFKIPNNFSGSLGGFESDLIWKNGANTDDISIKLYSNYFSPTGSTLLSSGSIRNFDDINVLKTYFGAFYPHTNIHKNIDYWIELTPLSGSVYKIAIDPNYNGLYSKVNYSGSIPYGTIYSGSIYGGLRYSPFMRMGGAHEFSLVVKCSAKNSIEKVQNLADLIEIYTKISQYGNLNRLLNSDTKIDLSMLSNDNVSFLTKRGLFIKNINKGGIENRKRGDNDVIFTISLTIEVRSEWYMDFDEKYIKEIFVNVC